MIVVFVVFTTIAFHILLIAHRFIANCALIYCFFAYLLSSISPSVYCIRVQFILLQRLYVLKTYLQCRVLAIKWAFCFLMRRRLRFLRRIFLHFIEHNVIYIYQQLLEQFGLLQSYSSLYIAVIFSVTLLFQLYALYVARRLYFLPHLCICRLNMYGRLLFLSAS